MTRNQSCNRDRDRNGDAVIGVKSAVTRTSKPITRPGHRDVLGQIGVKPAAAVACVRACQCAQLRACVRACVRAGVHVRSCVHVLVRAGARVRAGECVCLPMCVRASVHVN